MPERDEPVCPIVIWVSTIYTPEQIAKRHEIFLEKGDFLHYRAGESALTPALFVVGRIRFRGVVGHRFGRNGALITLCESVLDVLFRLIFRSIPILDAWRGGCSRQFPVLATNALPPKNPATWLSCIRQLPLDAIGYRFGVTIDAWIGGWT